MSDIDLEQKSEIFVIFHNKKRKASALQLSKCSFVLVKRFLHAPDDPFVAIRCQGVFGMNIQFTQKELSDYLNDMFFIVLLRPGYIEVGDPGR